MDKIEIAFADPKVDPIVVEADKTRIYEVISNLLTSLNLYRKEEVVVAMMVIVSVTALYSLYRYKVQPKIWER
jgi:hypothetical protein